MQRQFFSSVFPPAPGSLPEMAYLLFINSNSSSHMLDSKHNLFRKSFPDLPEYVIPYHTFHIISSCTFSSKQWSKLLFYWCVCNLINVCLSFTPCMLLLLQCVFTIQWFPSTDHKINFLPKKQKTHTNLNKSHMISLDR